MTNSSGAIMGKGKNAVVIGAGLAGSEAAWQLAQSAIGVILWDMKPQEMSPAHSMAGFGELVCSNSLKASRLESASGLLKEEMRRLDSLILKAADACAVPAGGALAVDRLLFSEYITNELMAHPNIDIRAGRVEKIPQGPCIVATGPLTDGDLFDDIAQMAGKDALYFFDAAAPIVTKDSIDMEKAYFKSRYDKGEGADYINCPMDKQQYDTFVDALLSAQTADIHGFEENMLFEGCMPVESMARRGRQTLAFGPMKPIGLNDPRTGKMPHAVVQLRQDDAAGEMYNLVGFQTRLKFPEQKRVFSMIPGLEKAEFVRYGVMHRNTYLNSPGFLSADYSAVKNPLIYFAGQISGVEGYVESAASGLVAGRSLAAKLLGNEPPDYTKKTMIGALAAYISAQHSRFDPMNANFSIIEPLSERIRSKKEKYAAYAARSLEHLAQMG
ncbi:MAG: methylenetetrahydrofolate--tRNA-(uracil(54)-C(5))-methyltransferase (FADH(2)-oxidizing) TrmFO [Christensenellales bacterium]|jgi:methylenetetrahydrofolate--tRNA-(uracil-5-)-methyltransferase